MKPSHAVVSLLCALVLHSSVSHSQGKDGLVAAPYPGSVRETQVGFPSWVGVPPDTRLGRYYSKDPVEKVKAHYEKALGPFEDAGNNEYSREVVPSREVDAILEKRGLIMGEAGGEATAGTFAGVMLYGKPNNYNVTVNGVMDALMSAYLMRYQNDENLEIAKHLEEAELKQTLARYEHVKWSHFAYGKDKAIFDKHYTDPDKAAGEELTVLVKKMTDLTTKMEYEEAGKVGDEMMKLQGRSTDAKYNWNRAIKCLDELKQNILATVIVIDKHPSVWDISKALGK